MVTINLFLSLEPLHGEIDLSRVDLGDLTVDYTTKSFSNLGGTHFTNSPKWIIVGAETGNRQGKIPKREWIQKIVDDCRFAKIPVFLKNNLAGIWGEPLIQEFPWDKRKL